MSLMRLNAINLPGLPSSILHSANDQNSYYFNCLLLLQMEAKVIMSRLLQQFRISLPEGYELHVASKATLQPKDNVLCTLVSI